MKLYTVEIASLPVEARCYYVEPFGEPEDDVLGDIYEASDTWEPEGWGAYCIGRWGEFRKFFWPSTRTIYRSRAAAQGRADLIESFGARARVLVTETRWESVDERRDRIAADKREKRIAALRAQIAAIEATA